MQTVGTLVFSVGRLWFAYEAKNKTITPTTFINTLSLSKFMQSSGGSGDDTVITITDNTNEALTLR